ncbi:thiamine-binding protein [Demequina silvatica]|uniref:thiamine-binding protein n=1 Tax=Demequina silvatica TaxID=1638988 RepID=UPI000783797F|nr:thiamine-binding protein [Demequina silvatica]
MIAEIQVLPNPIGTDDERYAYVDAAIEVIASSGMTFEVGAMGTTIEGAPDAVWALLRRVHEATMAAGAARCLSIIKVSESVNDSGPSIEELVRKHRP